MVILNVNSPKIDILNKAVLGFTILPRGNPDHIAEAGKGTIRIHTVVSFSTGL